MTTKNYITIGTAIVFAAGAAFISLNKQEQTAWNIEREFAFFEDTFKQDKNDSAVMAVQELKSMALYKTYLDFVANIPSNFDSDKKTIIIYRFAPSSSTVELLYIQFGSGHCNFVSARYQPKLNISGTCNLGDLNSKNIREWPVEFSFDGEILGLFISDNGHVERKIMSISSSNSYKFHLPEKSEEILSTLQSLL